MRSNRLFAIAVIACAAAAGAFMSAAVSTRDFIVSAARSGWARLSTWLEPAREGLPKSQAPSKPRVALVMAKAFVLRVLKRRPTVHPSWRMCPSI